MLVRIKDEISPHVTILSPESGSTYAAAVIVEGTVIDSSGADNTDGEISHLYYELIPAAIEGADVEVGEDGTFSFQFFTAAFTESILVRVVAEDWNGNTSSASITLVNGGAIPSFTPTAGNGHVTLNWDPVALAESYTVYYETADIIPNEANSSKLENVESPLTISELTNGAMHTFLLRAHSSEGEDNRSTVEKAMPLSEFHLTPRLSINFDSILAEWNTIHEIEEYQVWKSLTETGQAVNISGNIQRDYFLDTAVEPGKSYWYSIKAGSYNNNWSEAVDARLREIPENDERLVGIIGGFDYARDVVVSGSYAYLADGYNGMHIIDIFNPEKPVRVAVFNTPGYCNHVEVQGNYAYLTDDSRDANINIWDSGLHIINIANPSVPVEVGSVDTSYAAESVKVTNDYAYVVTYKGVAIVDITVKSNPQEVSFYVPPSFSGTDTIKCLFIIETELFIGTSTNFRIADIETPTMPNEYAKSVTSGGSKLTVNGDFAYLVSSSKVKVFNLNDESPIPVYTEYNIFDMPYDLDTVGSYLYVADSREGLKILDIHDPMNPIQVGFYNTRGRANAVRINGHLAYISDGESGMAVADIRNPAFAAQIFEDTGYSEALGIAVRGDSLYVADSTNGVTIYDISNPEIPSPIGIYDVGCSYLVVRGKYAYVTGSSGFEIVDISDPVAPVQRSSVDMPSGGLGIAMKGHIVYVAGLSNGLTIIDASDPDSAFEIKTIPAAGTVVNDVRLHGNYLYSMENTLFRVFDLTNPKSPFEIGRVESLTSALSIGFYYNYCYLTDLFGGLRIFDITYPFNMTELAVYDGVTNPVIVEIYGSYAFVTDYYDGLYILDISDPAAPVELNHLDAGGSGRGLFPFEDYMFYTAGSGGLKVIDMWP